MYLRTSRSLLAALAVTGVAVVAAASATTLAEADYLHTGWGTWFSQPTDPATNAAWYCSSMAGERFEASSITINLNGTWSAATAANASDYGPAPPRFRSRKDNRRAIRFTKDARFKVLDNGRLRLPKIGDGQVRWSRTLPCYPSSATVVKDAAGRYFASFVVQATGDETLPPVESEIGIDLGVTHFAVLSDGTKVTAPKFLRRAARKLTRLQQDLSRKTKGSDNRKKAVVQVARAHARVADTRRDWQHKLSTAIIRDNQAVYVEDLCVTGLGRTRPAKSVHDAGWASFTAMSECKAARYGRTFAPVDRFFASTRMCSDCGRTGEKMALDVRAWTCPCGSVHDRDVNAAKNVLAQGRWDNSNDRGAQVRPGLVPAPRGDAVTHPYAACSARSVEGIPAL